MTHVAFTRTQTCENLRRTADIFTDEASAPWDILRQLSRHLGNADGGQPPSYRIDGDIQTASD